MTNLIVSAGFSIGVLVLQVWLPGVILCLLLDRNKKLTLTDSYLVGWLWNVLLGFTLTPFSIETESVSLGIRAGCVLLGLIFLFTQFNVDRNPLFSSIGQLVSRSTSKWHFWIALTTTILFFSFVASHNVGFDDVANLHYVDQLLGGSVYPEHRELIGDWEAARYPMWGVVMGGLSYSIPGAGLFIYYFLGTSILVAFVLKIYEFMASAGKDKLTSLSAVFLVVAVLMGASLDNYFNYGVYPLQQSKLIYILGLLYLIFGWWFDRSRISLILGTGLVTAAAFYHLNLLLLHGAFLCIFVLLIYAREKCIKKWFVSCMILGVSLLIVIPSAFAPENGFFQLRDEPDIVTEVKVKRVEPSWYEKLLQKAEKVIDWIKRGDRTYSYSVRAFSLEVLWIPLIVVLYLRFATVTRFRMLIITLSSLMIVSQTVTAVPRQMVSSFLRSGTVWMLFDLHRSGIDFDQQGEVLTDAYTSLYLRLLGVKNFSEMNEETQQFAFAPLIPLQCRNFIKPNLPVKSGDRYLLNGRYWGMRAVERWTEEDYSHYQIFIDQLENAQKTASMQKFPEVMRSGINVVLNQLMVPVLQWTYHEDLVSNECQLKNLGLPRVYRDSGLASIDNIKEGESITFMLESERGVASYVGQYGDQSKQKILMLEDSDKSEKSFTFRAHHDADMITLLFQIRAGHFSGLGELESISVVRK